MLYETEEQADWLKIPSEVLISLQVDGEIPEDVDVVEWLEQNAPDSPLLRRLKEDPDFEERLFG